MIELLYRGFDALDVSFKGQITPKLSQALEAAKAQAQDRRGLAPLEWNGQVLNVYESGARGGYAYMATTGVFGATWFFKKPNPFDPWGVRVSCNSFFLATHGLGAARAEIYGFMAELGITLQPDAESIGRVDYALDFFVPGFILDPTHFVMHSQAGRTDNIEAVPLLVHGRSGRTTSVTVGKMPGRQVIVYDKRAEIVARGKVGWWEIWDAARAQNGHPPLVRDDPSEASIWRVEIRAGKRHLKDEWRITAWSDLDNRFGDMTAKTVEVVRHTTPTNDSNRSRWLDSRLWQAVRECTSEDLFEMQSRLPPDLVKTVQRDQHLRLLARQMDGLLISSAAIQAIEPDQLADYAKREGRRMASEIRLDPSGFAARLTEAAKRYRVERGPERPPS